MRIPTKAESTTTSKISSISGSFARHSGSHSRTLFVSSAVRMPRVAQLAHEVDHRLVRLEALEVELAQAVEVEAVAELALDARERTPAR